MGVGCMQMTHKRREETIRSMESITTQLLVAFYKKTGRKPESLIMYRDGVGEGHFDNVMKYEGKCFRHTSFFITAEVSSAEAGRSLFRTVPVVPPTEFSTVCVLTFPGVLALSVAAMIKAFESIEHGYRPKITFLIVQKRNKMRFFPQGEVWVRTISEAGLIFQSRMKPMCTGYFTLRIFQNHGMYEYTVMCANTNHLWAMSGRGSQRQPSGRHSC